MTKIDGEIKLLTVTTWVLLVNGFAQTATAAPSVEKGNQYRDRLPQYVMDTMIIGALGITGVGVLLGTGLSIKHEKKSSPQKSSSKSSQKISVNPNQNGFKKQGNKELTSLNSNSNFNP